MTTTVDLVAAPFTRERFYELGRRENWGVLLARLKPVIDLPVTDVAHQGIIDKVRGVLDASKHPDAQHRVSIVAIVLSAAESDNEAYETLKLLLEAGAHPDRPDEHGWTPAHVCSLRGFPRTASAIIACRAKLTKKNGNNHTAYEAAMAGYTMDEDFPGRSVFRAEVANVMEQYGFGSANDPKYPELPLLAVKKMWFVVLNLARRNVLSKREFTLAIEGKTAAQWAVHYGETKIADELDFYAHGVKVRLFKATKKIQELQSKLLQQADYDMLTFEVAGLKRRVNTLQAELDTSRQDSQEKASELAAITAERESLKAEQRSLESAATTSANKIQALEETLAGKELQIAKLSGALAAFKRRASDAATTPEISTTDRPSISSEVDDSPAATVKKRRRTCNL